MESSCPVLALTIESMGVTPPVTSNNREWNASPGLRQQVAGWKAHTQMILYSESSWVWNLCIFWEQLSPKSIYTLRALESEIYLYPESSWVWNLSILWEQLSPKSIYTLRAVEPEISVIRCYCVCSWVTNSWTKLHGNTSTKDSSVIWDRCGASSLRVHYV